MNDSITVTNIVSARISMTLGLANNAMSPTDEPIILKHGESLTIALGDDGRLLVERTHA